MAFELDHVSASQIKMFLRCPMQWYYRYIEGLKIPPPGSWAAGTSGHETAKKNFLQKPETKVDLPIDEIQDFFGEHMNQTVDEYVWEDKKEFNDTRDKGIRAIAHWREMIAPPIMPISADHVEAQFEIPLQNVSYKIIGYIDVEEVVGVSDMKFVGRKWNEESAAKEIQPYVYSMKTRLEQAAAVLEAKERGEDPVIPDPKSFWFHIVTTAKTPKAQSIKIDVPDEQLQEFLGLIGYIVNCIEKEIFPPCWGNYLCSKSSCGYYEKCRKKFETKIFINDLD